MKPKFQLKWKYRVALGCDFDGTDRLPVELPDVGALPKLREALSERKSPAFADRVFYENASRFAASHLKP